jgi:uncharacterized membrane protein
MNGNLKVNPHKSSLGLDANVLALLAYIATFVLLWIPVIKWVAWAAPLVVFILEKGSPFVKYHAMQAMILAVINLLFSLIITIIIAAATASIYTFSGAYASLGIISALTIIMAIIGIVLTVFAIIAAVKAYGYVEYKIPLIGKLAAKFAYKGNMPY